MALPGQGNALPAGIPFRGQWIAEPRFFLFEPGTIRGLPGDDEIAQKADLPSGGFAIGFDAAQVASGLQVGMADLFEENRAGRLRLRLGQGTAAAGAAKALQCALELGGRNVVVTVQRYDER